MDDNLCCVCGDDLTRFDHNYNTCYICGENMCPGYTCSRTHPLNKNKVICSICYEEYCFAVRTIAKEEQNKEQ